MTRAQSVTFLNFLSENGKYRFDYKIDDTLYSINLSHSIQSSQPDNVQRTILFNLGMCYLLDLIELVVPEKIQIHFSLTDLQLHFWKSLYKEVAPEKMYLHSLDLALLDAEWQVDTTGESFPSVSLKNQSKKALCLTGGKESLTLLKLLKEDSDLLLFFLNPETNFHRHKVFERVKDQFTTVRTLSDRPEIIKKIKQKYQTTFGSGVDMAHLVFNTMLLGCKYVIIGNEYSSNYPNLMYQGSMINHQYIKTIHFAQKINDYIHQCVTKDFSYYSPFFGLYELKIASKLFSDDEFLEVWTSCNKTTPETNFCSKCSKCAFTYLVALTYTSEAFLSTYFSRDMLQDVELFKPLQDFTGEKPLDCVGEKIEVWTALNILSQKNDQKEKPVIRYFIEKIKPLIENELPQFEKEIFSIHTVPTELPPELSALLETHYKD